MKPDAQEQNPADLMMPVPSQEQKTAQEPVLHDSIHEADAAAAVERAQSAPDPFAVSAAAPATAVPIPQDQGSISSASTTAAVSTPMIADDADLIEKEWVEKAKYIVEQTKHDPHLQTKELNKLKSEYLKKRYNKDLKLSDE